MLKKCMLKTKQRIDLNKNSVPKGFYKDDIAMKQKL